MSESSVEDHDDVVEQLQPADTLLERGVADALDEGYVAPDHWSVGEGYGNTPAEARAGETLEMRLKQEEPEVVDEDDDWRHGEEGRQVGRERAGRLVASYGGQLGRDHEDEALAYEVGIDGGAASAEEAAMHIIDPDDEEFDDLD